MNKLHHKKKRLEKLEEINQKLSQFTRKLPNFKENNQANINLKLNPDKIKLKKPDISIEEANSNRRIQLIFPTTSKIRNTQLNINDKTKLKKNDNENNIKRNGFKNSKSRVIFSNFYISNVYYSKRKKIFVFINNYIVVHLIVILLTVCKIYGQNNYLPYCWLETLCKCNFEKKVLATLIIIFFRMNLFTIAGYKTSIKVISNTYTRQIYFWIYFWCCFCFSFTYFLSTETYNPDYIYIFIAISPLMFHLNFYMKQILMS